MASSQAFRVSAENVALRPKRCFFVFGRSLTRVFRTWVLPRWFAPFHQPGKLSSVPSGRNFALRILADQRCCAAVFLLWLVRAS